MTVATGRLGKEADAAASGAAATGRSDANSTGVRQPATRAATPRNTKAPFVRTAPFWRPAPQKTVNAQPPPLTTLRSRSVSARGGSQGLASYVTGPQVLTAERPAWATSM